VALLDGGLAGVFAAAFSSIYLPGYVHVPEDPVYDEGGSKVPGTGSMPYPCRLQVDSVTQRMRQAEGYADKDVRILILASGLEADVTTDCEVEVRAGMHQGRYMIASVDRDPAGASFDCRGRRA
jgi:hypothetical protein